MVEKVGIFSSLGVSGILDGKDLRREGGRIGELFGRGNFVVFFSLSVAFAFAEIRTSAGSRIVMFAAPFFRLFKLLISSLFDRHIFKLLRSSFQSSFPPVRWAKGVGVTFQVRGGDGDRR